MADPLVNWETVAHRLHAVLINMRLTHCPVCDVSLCPVCNEAQTADVQYRVLVEAAERRRNEALDN